MAEDVIHGKNTEFDYLRPDRECVNNAYFGLDGIRVLHGFLETVVRVPTEDFEISVMRLRFQILTHVRWMQEKAGPCLMGGRS